MKLRIIELPDDHAFLSPVRSLVDGVFKVIGWLALSATIQVAAEATQSAPLLWLAYIGCFTVLFYLQKFLNWLTHGKLPGMTVALRDARPGRSSKLAGIRLLSRVGVPLLGLVIWISIIAAIQVTIGRSATSIVEYQKSSKK